MVTVHKYDKNENIISLLNFLKFIKEMDFIQLYNFRVIAKELLLSDISNKTPEIFTNLILLIKQFFPSLKEIDFKKLKNKEFIKILDDQFLMKKQHISEIAKEKGINIKSYIEKIKNSALNSLFTLGKP